MLKLLALQVGLFTISINDDHWIYLIGIRTNETIQTIGYALSGGIVVVYLMTMLIPILP